MGSNTSVDVLLYENATIYPPRRIAYLGIHKELVECLRSKHFSRGAIIFFHCKNCEVLNKLLTAKVSITDDVQLPIGRRCFTVCHRIFGLCTTAEETTKSLPVLSTANIGSHTTTQFTLCLCNKGLWSLLNVKGLTPGCLYQAQYP